MDLAHTCLHEPKAKFSPRAAEPRRPGSTKPHPEGPSGGLEEGTDKPVSSESDAEGPIAAQMLSFVMDDPDFESDSDAQRRAVRTSLAPVLLASPGQLGGRGTCRPRRGGSQGTVRPVGTAGLPHGAPCTTGTADPALGTAGGLPRHS